MERAEKSIIHLDTHVVAWLFSGEAGMFSKKIDALLTQEQQLWISPMVLLELQYMHEIKRIKKSAAELALWLTQNTVIRVAQVSFSQVIEKACGIHWTRDAFDRLITATAATENAMLVTKDRNIRKHYKKAIW